MPDKPGARRHGAAAEEEGQRDSGTDIAVFIEFSLDANVVKTSQKGKAQRGREMCVSHVLHARSHVRGRRAINYSPRCGGHRGNSWMIQWRAKHPAGAAVSRR